jgi:hypothetical protein
MLGGNKIFLFFKSVAKNLFVYSFFKIQLNRDYSKTYKAINLGQIHTMD